MASFLGVGRGNGHLCRHLANRRGSRSSDPSEINTPYLQSYSIRSERTGVVVHRIRCIRPEENNPRSELKEELARQHRLRSA